MTTTRAPEVISGTIVAAEDSPEILRLLVHILRRVAEHVVGAPDGEAAWEAIRTHRPRVAVLDADMRRRTGLEVAALVRADPGLAGTRILVIGVHHDAERHALAAGADRALAKPFRPSDLLEEVRALAAA